MKTARSTWRRALSILVPSSRKLVWIGVLLVLVSGLGYSFRAIGFIRFESEIRKLGAGSCPLAVRRSDDPQRNAAILLQDLEQLVESGKVRIGPDPEEPDSLGGGALTAALAAFGRARDLESIPYDRALDRAIAEILRERVPSPDAWVLVESWLPKMEEVFLMVDRIGERPEWRFDGALDALQSGVGTMRTLHLVNTLHLLDDLVRWVSVAAIREARAGDPALALRRLRQGFHLSRATRDEPSSLCFIGFVLHLSMTMEALRQVLRDLPADQDVSWIQEEIEAVDSISSLKRAVTGDRDTILEMYRRGQLKELLTGSLLVGLLGHRYSGSGPLLSFGMGQAVLYPLVAGHDAARFLELSAEVMRWLDGSLADISILVEDLAEHWGEPPWYAPSAPCVASLLTMGIPACVDLESEVRLAKIALTDRAEGRDAALEILGRTLDPANDLAIGQRDEEDGTVTLWCVGSDRIDMGGFPDEGDVVWTLPTRQGTR